MVGLMIEACHSDSYISIILKQFTMADYHNVYCRKCKKSVEAELVNTSLTKNFYQCPNADYRGRTHIFPKTKAVVNAVRGATFLLSVLGIPIFSD